MKYTLEGNKSRLNKKRTGRVMEITTTEQKKRTKRNEDSLRDLRDNIKEIMFAWNRSQKEKKERAWENIWRHNSWKFPNQGKERVTHVQEAQPVPYRMSLVGRPFGSQNWELGAWAVPLSISPRDRPCHLMSQNCYRHNWLIIKKLGYFYMMGAGNNVC